MIMGSQGRIDFLLAESTAQGHKMSSLGIGLAEMIQNDEETADLTEEIWDQVSSDGDAPDSEKQPGFTICR